jgi:endonuclease/exonuclease/phosphatase family metal-dependent hydrolase
MQELVVMTQNVFGGALAWKWRKSRLARAIAQINPDLVGLQEVHATRIDAIRTQAHEIAELAGTYHVDFAPGRIAPDGRCEGVALLCKREIRERSVFALTLDRRDRLDRAGQRVVLCATLELGPVIDVFVTHLSLSWRARARTIDELVRFAERERSRSKSDGAILLGDLNATPGEAAMRALNERWVDAWRGPGGATWPLVAPSRRIDYVLAQPPSGWAVRGCGRRRTLGSDHLGVVARLGLAGSSDTRQSC